MVDHLGRWVEAEDYSTYPKEAWCDMDYVANYIRGQNYEPETAIENLILMTIAYFEDEIESGNSEFEPMYNENLMININKLSEFVRASGGLREFDYYA